VLGIEKGVDPGDFMVLRIHNPVRGNAGWRRFPIDEM
jgi:hypothetical protein